MEESLPKLKVDPALLHARDRALLEKIVVVYGPVLKAIFKPGAVDENHVDDLVQGFWAHFLSRLDRYSGKAPFGPWLVRVAKNYRASCARREAKEAARTVALEEGLEVASEADAPDDVAQRRLLERAVYEVLDRLPERERKVIMLTLMDERSDAEAAEIMDASPATIATLKRRALFKLQGENRLRMFHEDL